MSAGVMTGLAREPVIGPGILANVLPEMLASYGQPGTLHAATPNK